MQDNTFVIGKYYLYDGWPRKCTHVNKDSNGNDVPHFGYGNWSGYVEGGALTDEQLLQFVRSAISVNSIENAKRLAESTDEYLNSLYNEAFLIKRLSDQHYYAVSRAIRDLPTQVSMSVLDDLIIRFTQSWAALSEVARKQAEPSDGIVIATIPPTAKNFS